MYYDYEEDNLKTDNKKKYIISSIIIVFIIIIGIVIIFSNNKDKYEFTLNNSSLVILRGNRRQIKIKDNNKNINYDNYEYHIKDLSIARVNDEGNIIGLKEGNTDLLVTSKESNVTKTIKIIVSKNPEEEKIEEVKDDIKPVEEEKKKEETKEQDEKLQKEQEEKKKNEELLKKQEEAKKAEEQKRIEEEKKAKEEAQRQAEEEKKKVEERERQEAEKKAEEEKKEQEEKKAEEAKKEKIQVPLRTSDGSVLMGGDPYVKYYNGYYYYLSTSGNDIKISVSKNLQDIGKPEKVVTVYKNPYNRVIWAPELHYIQGRWYIYYTNSNGDDYYDRRSYVLRSKTNNPLGEYQYMGQIKDSKHDYYAIDGTPLEWNGQLYFVYSGMPTKKKSGYQNLYIAHMSNPWTIDSERVEISSPTYSWEKKNAHINEAPEILIKNNTLHIIYSANGAQSKYYCLGMLTYNGGNILSKKAWTKTSKPVFESGNGVYGVGHASFTTSRDGKENWIVYHAYANSNSSTIKNWQRSIRIKKFTWNGNIPVFGTPAANNTYINVPSGSI